ncbi:MAG: tetratricopeptide repeat protein [Janthinobacterium lividum]
MLTLFRRRPDPLARARSHAAAGAWAEAVALWQPLAEAGDVRAQANLGACLATGRGVDADPGEARRWLACAADAGDRVAGRNLATLLLDTDRAEAVRCYQRAAEAGDPPSQDMLSRMLLDGDGVPPDAQAARHWAEQAAAAGEAAAAARLGRIHHEAIGTPRDPAAAVHWWHRAALAGDADAAAMLGAALLLGQGAAADPVEALAWLLAASARGSALPLRFLPAAQRAASAEDNAEAERRAVQRRAAVLPAGDLIEV